MEGFSTPGIKFYRMTVNITYPLDYDVPLGFYFDIPSDKKCRVELFVNGYQMGRYVPHIGPQFMFPVYPGIINRGENVVALAVWGMHELRQGEAFKFKSLYLEALEVFRSGYAPVDGEGLIGSYPEGRKRYEVGGGDKTEKVVKK